VTPLSLAPPGDPGLAPAAALVAARAHVAAALPGEPAHEAHRERMLAFVDDHPDALQRSCPEGHESLDVPWVSADELPAYGADDGLLRLGRAAAAAVALLDA
jgi:hypothetical protein